MKGEASVRYIHRSLERKFLKMSGSFKVVMVTGARPVRIGMPV